MSTDQLFVKTPGDGGKKLHARIAAWRRQQDDMPTLSEAVRRLLDEALSAHEAKASKRKG